MRIISIIFVFLFTGAVQAAKAQDFKVLKYEEFKKLTKEQQVEYVKELAKRMTPRSKSRPHSFNFNANKPSRLTVVLADVVGLPMAFGESDDDEAARLEQQAADTAKKAQEARARKAAQQRAAEVKANDERLKGGSYQEYQRNQELIKAQNEQTENRARIRSLEYQESQRAEEERTKPVPAQTEDQERDRYKLEGRKIELESKQKEIDYKLRSIEAKASENANKILKNFAQTNDTVDQISELEAQNRELNKTPDDSRPAVERNLEKIEKLNERLKELKAEAKTYQEQATFLRNTTEDLKTALNSDANRIELQSVEKKLSDIHAQLQARDKALLAHGKLVEDISKEEQKVADIKKELQRLEVEKARAQNAMENADTDGERERQSAQVAMFQRQIDGKEADLKKLSGDVDKKVEERKKLATRAGIDIAGKPITPASTDDKKDEKKPDQQQVTLTPAQKKLADKRCVEPIKEEFQAICEQAKNAKVVDAPAKPAGGAGGGGHGPHDPGSGSPGKAEGPGKPKVESKCEGTVDAKGECKPKGDGKDDKEVAQEFCPHAGFIMKLGSPAGASCPPVSSADQDSYVGKITQGPAAKAKCPSKAYGPEQTILCHPIVFGLTQDNEGICVAPSQKATENCVTESKNKKGYEKAVEVIKENEKAYKEFFSAFSKMCNNDNLKGTSPRVVDTKDTCAQLGIGYSLVEDEVAKRKKAPTPTDPPAGSNPAAH